MTLTTTAATTTERGTPHAAVPPRVGMVGAGQLARMTHQAAIALGVELHVLTENVGDAAVRAGARMVRGRPAAAQDLARLAAACDVVTFDHELVAPETLAALERAGHRLRPPAAAKRLAQDKLAARRVLGQRLGLPVPAFQAVQNASDAERFARRHGWPIVLKARRGGYDGRGVWIARDRAGAHAITARAHAAGMELLVEEHVPIERELAVLVARRPTGETATYPVVETVQRDGVCREVIAPAPGHLTVAEPAHALARQIAAGIDAVGILAVELFLTPERLVINELALRPHNSGHLTIDACSTGQFENHLRAVLDWPLGSTELLGPAAAMVNVLGPPDGSDPAARLHRALAISGAHVHLYGKHPQVGRKLGHVTALGAHVAEALDIARRAALELAGP